MYVVTWSVRDLGRELRIRVAHGDVHDSSCFRILHGDHRDELARREVELVVVRQRLDLRGLEQLVRQIELRDG